MGDSEAMASRKPSALRGKAVKAIPARLPILVRTLAPNLVHTTSLDTSEPGIPVRGQGGTLVREDERAARGQRVLQAINPKRFDSQAFHYQCGILEAFLVEAGYDRLGVDAGTVGNGPRALLGTEIEGEAQREASAQPFLAFHG